LCLKQACFFTTLTLDLSGSLGGCLVFVHSHLICVNRDDLGRLFEPLISRVPILVTNGNHEIEPGFGPDPVKTYQAYNARFPMPPARPQPGGRLPTSPNAGSSPRDRDGDTNLWYASELPGAYLITLTQYFDYSESSDQFRWFVETASNVDRTRFPWLIVMHHLPLYNTLISHYVEGECFRKIFEPLFFKYGVDFVLTGERIDIRA